MILGRGSAQTDEAIVAEYHQFLSEFHPLGSTTIRQRLCDAPGVMQRRIGKPPSQWQDEEIILLFADRTKATLYPYRTFLAFLLFRGYRRATLSLLTSLPFFFSRHFRQVLAPWRQRLEQTLAARQYQPDGVGTMLNILVYLLAVVGKPLEEITRADYEAFRQEYQTWYQQAQRQASGRPDSRLFRLEVCLVHWGIIPPARVVFRHELHFAQLRHASIQSAILLYMQWCDAKYKPSTIHSKRAGLLTFFHWLQTHYPTCGHLDGVSRPIALDYARYLKGKVEEGVYSSHYANDLYRVIRFFFNFAIEEQMERSPNRNPFGYNDLPRRPDPVPRYLSDHDVRAVLAYCHNGASLQEKTFVITLLHTGIRAAELAALKVSNIVQIQGTWKLHIQEGKGLKDRLIPLTEPCLATLQAWKQEGWEGINDFLFTHHGQPWQGGLRVGHVIRQLGRKLGLIDLTPHRFRHTFAVALLNYGIRESALQKLMGHATLNMTLEYARILDQTVEKAFNTAVGKMQTGPLRWVPDFFAPDDYPLFAAEDAVNWIRLPHGYCRRHPKFHCESDVKCLLCDRFCASPADLPRLQEMQQQFLHLGLQLKAEVVQAHIVRLQDVVVLNPSLMGHPRTEEGESLTHMSAR